MMRRHFVWIALVAVAGGCAADDGPGGSDLSLGKADTAFADDSFSLTGAFDGSQRFGMWVDTMEFARRVERDHGKRIRWTYFINTCYYDRTVRGSWIGTALSREEEIVRWALTQQAINEGHEIGGHSVRHQDGTGWSATQWRADFREYTDLTEANLFEPIIAYNAGNPEPVFPVWRSVAEAGEVGASCRSDSECDSGACLPVSATRSFCTTPCNSRRLCPAGTVCGAPDWNESTDVCVPMPQFPVEHEGQVLFDGDGNANLNSALLRPYDQVGFRAPQLGQSTGLYEVLTEFGYQYDTSQVIPVGPPQRTRYQGRTFDQLYQFGLMKNAGSATIPMDYNYEYGSFSGERMRQDYYRSIIDAYNQRNRQPWNIGHHFALWRNGEYWQAMQDAFEYAARGCPVDGGTLACAQTRFPTFRELAAILDGMNQDSADEWGVEDIFDNPVAEEGEDRTGLDEDSDCHSEEHCP